MGEGRERKMKGLVWKLPVVKSMDFGKMGPAIGFGGGCGLGFGVGLLGGVGFGPGIPGLQVGFGFGAGCGVGLGFGYGMGKGIAQDDCKRYSNVGNPFLSLETLFARTLLRLWMTSIVDDYHKYLKSLSGQHQKKMKSGEDDGRVH